MAIERDRLFRRVAALMEWDNDTTALWFRTENPTLGGVSPDWMIEHDRARKLAEMIEEAEYAAGLRMMMRGPAA